MKNLLVFSHRHEQCDLVSDVDSDGNAEQVSLSVSNGTLTLSRHQRALFSTGTGTANSAMTFTGTLANINAVMWTDLHAHGQLLRQRQPGDMTNDLGNTGLGGAKTASSTVAITVSEVNQPPVNTVPGSQRQ